MKIIALGVSFMLCYTLTAQTLPELPNEISPILIGEKIPDISLRRLDAKPQMISEILDKHLTILICYRGGWCPYCNNQLIAIAKAEEMLIDIGYQIIAISPDSPKSLLATTEDNDLNYTLYSDSHGELMRALGIAYKVPETHLDRAVKGSDGENNSFLPVPSIFIIGSNREVLFEYINPNFKQRISVELLTTVCKCLMQKKNRH